MRISKILFVALAAASATPAFAQDATDPPSEFTISGSATVVSDYRFRGFTQSGEEAAIQGGFSVSHDSGLYIGTWGSSINFNNGAEVDIYGGFSTEVSPGLTADIGATLYLYPGSSGTTVVEPYASLTGTVGPASIKGGVAWAPGGQTALGDASGVYLFTDVGVSVPETPITLKAHLGYAKSDSFLGGYDGDGEVVDYSFGAEVSWKSLTLGISYVNTNERNPSKEANGADGAVLFSIGASF